MRPGTSISNQNFKGGVGKSTISVNMAHVLSLAEYNVLIVDMDEQGSTTEIFKVYDDNGTPMNKVDIVKLDHFSLYTQPVDMGRYIKRTNYKNIDIIPNARIMSPEAPFDSRFDMLKIPKGEKYAALRNNLGKVIMDYDFIIIDGQPHAGRMSDISILASDYVITPVEPDTFNTNTVLDVTDRISMLNAMFGTKVEFAGFFLNKSTPKDKNEADTRKYYLETYPEFFIDHPIRLSTKVARNSGLSGKLFLEYTKRSGPSLDILNLVVNELGLVDEEHQKELEKNGISRKYFNPINDITQTDL